jgi:hypothetical protein
MQDKEAFLYVGPCDLPQSVPNFTHGIKIGCWSMDFLYYSTYRLQDESAAEVQKRVMRVRYLQASPFRHPISPIIYVMQTSRGEIVDRSS